jgi:hypothetical protein
MYTGGKGIWFFRLQPEDVIGFKKSAAGALQLARIVENDFLIKDYCGLLILLILTL